MQALKLEAKHRRLTALVMSSGGFIFCTIHGPKSQSQAVGTTIFYSGNVSPNGHWPAGFVVRQICRCPKRIPCQSGWSLRWPAEDYFAVEAAAFICSKAEICGLQLRADGFDFFRLVQLDLLKMFHRGLLLRLGLPVLRIGELLLRGLNLFLHLGAGLDEFVHRGRRARFRSRLPARCL